MITITEEQYDKLRGILMYADWWLDDYPKDMYPEHWKIDSIVEQNQVVKQREETVA